MKKSEMLYLCCTRKQNSTRDTYVFCLSHLISKDDSQFCKPDFYSGSKRLFNGPFQISFNLFRKFVTFLERLEGLAKWKAKIGDRVQDLSSEALFPKRGGFLLFSAGSLEMQGNVPNSYQY